MLLLPDIPGGIQISSPLITVRCELLLCTKGVLAMVKRPHHLQSTIPCRLLILSTTTWINAVYDELPSDRFQNAQAMENLEIKGERSSRVGGCWINAVRDELPAPCGLDGRGV